MKIYIKVGQEFTENGIKYECVGHDNNMVWGVNDDLIESIPFDPHNCTPISKFTTS